MEENSRDSLKIITGLKCKEKNLVCLSNARIAIFFSALSFKGDWDR